MAAVNTASALALVKARLNRLDDLLDDYLAARISAAVMDLEATGIRLTGSDADLMLVVDYTCWAYANRDAQAGMPDWLRLRRRERFLNRRREEAES
jgi:hypothetical protein